MIINQFRSAQFARRNALTPPNRVNHRQVLWETPQSAEPTAPLSGGAVIDTTALSRFFLISFRL